MYTTNFSTFIQRSVLVCRKEAILYLSVFFLGESSIVFSSRSIFLVSKDNKVCSCVSIFLCLACQSHDRLGCFFFYYYFFSCRERTTLQGAAVTAKLLPDGFSATICFQTPFLPLFGWSDCYDALLGFFGGERGTSRCHLYSPSRAGCHSVGLYGCVVACFLVIFTLTCAEIRCLPDMHQPITCRSRLCPSWSIVTLQ